MKKLIIAVVSLIVLAIAGSFFLERWLAKSIPEILNSNEDRNFDLKFEDINISLFKSRVDLNAILLVPLNDSVSTKVNGSLRSITMSGVDLKKIVFSKKLEINELKIVEPAFRLIQKDIETNAQESSQAFQDLFQDIISRGEIKDFILVNGTAEIFTENDSLFRLGQFTDLNLEIIGLETDSALIQETIPFRLQSVKASMKNIAFKINADQTFKAKELNYRSQDNELTFHYLSFNYNDEIVEASKKAEFEKDLIEFDIKELKLSYINAKSTIYGNWMMDAGLVTIDSLNLVDFRNKNMPLGDEPVKPMFEGVIDKIPFSLKLDTIRIANSKISYQQIGLGKSEVADLSFENVSAEILDLLSTDSLQQGKTLTIKSKARLKGETDVTMDIQVPYGDDVFQLQANVSAFNLSQINELLNKMAGVKMESGRLLNMALTMDANKYSSRNTMVFDYQDLKVVVLSDDKSKGGINKLFSTAANLLTSKENIPNSKNYKTASYTTKRNMYKGPFNLVWESSREGLMEIVPVGIAKLFID